MALNRPLPEEIGALADLALDLRLTGSHTVDKLWETIDPDTWERVKNPLMILQHASREKLLEAAGNPQFRETLEARWSRWKRYLESPGWFQQQDGCEALQGVAYFSMEFGLSEALPIYSGGLGILAGDHMKSASDLGVPLHGIGLLYQQGYFRQMLAEDGRQMEAFPYNDPGTLPITPLTDADGRWPRIRIELPGRTLYLRVWRAQVGKASLYLLDSNHPLNNPWDRGITANLYAAGKEKRLLQEIVLGLGGWRLLQKLGIEVDVCHLNEGHAAFAILARAASFAEIHDVPFETALRATRAGNVFTTHTPVEAAFDQFSPALLAKYAQPFLGVVGTTLERVLAMGRRNPEDTQEPFNMAYLAMRGSGFINGVSRLHGSVSRRLFRCLFPGLPEPEVPVGHVTNGVHVPTWDSISANKIWSQAYQGDKSWPEELQLASSGLQEISDEELWDFRAAQRFQLVEYVRQRLARQVQEHGGSQEAIRHARHALDPNTLTLGFARRFTEYKRPNLLLYDAERFARFLLDNEHPAQMIIAGKAHPNDESGKAMVRRLAQFARRADVWDRVIFLEDYDIALARQLAAGVDVWLNNPRRPAEACGTSGMKMIVNGGLHFSTLDGWWDEAYSPEVGFQIGGREEHQGTRDAADANSMYEVMENEIAKEFYNRDRDGIPRGWIERVRASMRQLCEPFSSDRMLRDYIHQAYLPAARAYQRRAVDDACRAEALERWRQQIEVDWHSVRFGDVLVLRDNDMWNFEVQAYLGDVNPEMVLVQLYAEPNRGESPVPITMSRQHAIHGTVNAFLYTAQVPAARPAEHYTPRILPFHEDAILPLECTRICWAR